MNTPPALPARNCCSANGRRPGSRATLLWILALWFAAAGSSLHAQNTVYEPYKFITIAGRAGVAGGANLNGTNATFSNPRGIAVDQRGNLYVGDIGNGAIRRITPDGAVSTISTAFSDPTGLAVDPAGNVYVADAGDHIIGKLSPDGGGGWTASTLAGLSGVHGTADGPATQARFYYPTGVAVDGAGDVFVADASNATIRRISASGVVSTLAGRPAYHGFLDGVGDAARFSIPGGIAVDPSGALWVADTANSTIRKVAPAGTNWVVSTLVGVPLVAAGSTDAAGSFARFYDPGCLALDPSGLLYVADTENSLIRKVIPSLTSTTTLAGVATHPGSTDGVALRARFKTPFGVTVDAQGNLYVADSGNNTIRKGWSVVNGDAPLLVDPNLGAGLVAFNLYSTPGAIVVLESSTNLPAWTPFSTNLLPNGWLQYDVPAVGSFPRQFFRAVIR